VRGGLGYTFVLGDCSLLEDTKCPLKPKVESGLCQNYLYFPDENTIQMRIPSTRKKIKI